MARSASSVATAPWNPLWRILGLCARAVVDSRITRVIREQVRHDLWRRRLRSLGSNAKLYPGVVIHSPEQVEIGANVAIAEFVHIWGGGEVVIGAHTMIASHVVITSQSHCKDPGRRREQIRAKVEIGENVWIGASAVILPGVSIGRNSIIGAGAVVTHNVPDNVVVTGVPARVMEELAGPPGAGDPPSPPR